MSTSLPVSLAPAWGPYGSAGLTGHIRRATLSFRYSHGYQPAIGLGVSQMTDNLALSATVPIGRRFDLLANGALSLRKSRIVASGPSEKDWDLYTGASCTLSRRLRLVGGYRFRTRDQSGSLVSEVVAPVRNNRASLSLVYGESGGWRSSR